MKKKILPILCLSTLLSLTITSCGTPSNKPTDTSNNITTSEVIQSYFVSFYVGEELYQTVRVKENETVGSIVTNPTKEGYTFSGWKTKDNTDFSLETTKITASIDLYASFTKNQTPIITPDDNKLNVEDTKDPTKNYYLVLGWYGKSATSGLDNELMTTFYKNVISYLKATGSTNDQINAISVRRYGDENTGVADMGTLINTDGDVDILLGVGNNVNTTGAVEIKEKTGDIMMGGKSRYISRLTDSEISVKVYEYMKTDNGKTLYNADYTYVAPSTTEPTDTVDPSDPSDPSTPVDPVDPTDPVDPSEPDVTDPQEGKLNVEDTKDPTKNYYLVLGWYGKSTTSGLDNELMTTFYKNVISYLKATGSTDEEVNSISVRRYGDEDTDVATMGSLINTDGDCDIVIGVGSNLTSKGLVETKALDGNIEMGGKTRYIARLTDSEISVKVYDYMLSENGRTLYNADYTYVAPSTPEVIDPTDPTDPEVNEPVEPTLNVEDVKDESKNYYVVIGWYGKSATSGLDNELMTTFYKNVITYLKSTGSTDEEVNSISVRRYGDENTDVATMGSLINADGDCDIVIGVGSNLTSKGLVETKALDGDVMMGGKSRYIARLTDSEVATSLYTYMLTENGRNLYNADYTI